jgi:lysozyme
VDKHRDDEIIELCADLLIKPFEGYAKRLPDGGCKAYPDPGTGGKPWTIGYGSTGPDINQHTVWTQEQALKALEDHLRYFLRGLYLLSPSLRYASINRVVALLSFAYNVGLGNYRISTLKKKVDAGEWEEAKEQIKKWNKANGRVMTGLTRRREAEAKLL